MKPPILIFLLLLIANPIYSQDTKPFYIGFTASPTIIWLKSETKEIDKASFDGLGFNYGMFTDIRIVSPEHYLSTGILRYHTISSLAYKIDTTIYIHTYRIQSIDIPLGYKLRFTDEDPGGGFAFVGITTSFLQKAKADLEPDFDGVNKEGIDFKDNIISVNFSFGFEGAIEFAMSDNILLLVGIYGNLGLPNYIYDRFEGDISPGYLGLRVGFVFF